MAGRIVEYQIINHSEPKDTQDEVNAFLSEGWELYGELIVNEYWAGGESDDAKAFYSYTQAMVRREASEFAFAAGD